jgi:predicted Rossmann fold nucleotide-binding protein DprA/Smf involved in DNA uptake
MISTLSIALNGLRIGADTLEIGVQGFLVEPEPAPFIAPVRRVAHADKDVDWRARIVDLLGPSPVSIDDLARLSEAPLAQLRVTLFELELEGLIERQGGALVSLISRADHSAR